MKNKIVSTIKTSAGELELSEDALCKHTIFIGSTGSGKTTSLNVLLRDIIGYNVEDETQKVGLLVFDLKGGNTLFKIRKWAKEYGREDDVIDYCADSKFYFDPLGGLDSFRKIPHMGGCAMRCFVLIRKRAVPLSRIYTKSQSRSEKFA